MRNLPPATFPASDGLTLAFRTDDFTDPWREPDSILLLHSMMGTADRYYRWVPTLAARFRVVRPDLRGHGASAVPTAGQPLTLERLVYDALELLDHLGIERAHVVGNSAGGYVAQRLALAHPERVRSLALFGSTAGLGRSGTSSWIPQIEREGLAPFLRRTIADRFPLGRVDPGLVEWFLDETAKCDQAFIQRWLRLTTALDWTPELADIRCPTLIVRPGGETVGTADHYREMADVIADVELLTYAGYPHNICDIVPEQCARDLLAFIERRFGGAAA